MGSALADATEGVFNIAEGFAKRKAMKQQADAKRYNARIAKLRGKQIGADMAEDLTKTLGAISAIRAGRGVRNDSPTARAIREDRRRDAADATNRAVLGEEVTAFNFMNEARQLDKAAPWALAGGFVKGFGKLAKAGESFFGGPPTGGS